MPVFSIIIPVYNVASYLRECLESILSQHFSGWECLCIDDGSTDGSLKILEQYASTDHRFHVFRQHHKGVSAARNTALDHAQGKFFFFLDGDDALSPDSLSSFRDIFTKTNCDGILCFPDEDFLSLGEYRNASGRYQIVSEVDRPVSLLSGPYATHGRVQSRIYRRSVFGRVRFPVEVTVAEDLWFWTDALCLAARWTVVQKRYYAYRVRNDSASHVPSWSLYRDCLRSYEYVFSTMSGKMGATQQEIKQFATRFRAAHHYIFIRAYRFQQNASNEIQCDFFRLADSVLEAAKPAFPFYKTDLLRLIGFRLGLTFVANPLANIMDKLINRLRRWKQLFAGDSSAEQTENKTIAV